MSADVLIAVRGGRSAKSRCAKVLAPAVRERLVEAMLRDMLDVALKAPGVRAVHVVTPTASLARVAHERGARAILEEDPIDLNGAFELGRARIAAKSALVLLPGDLPALDPRELANVIAAWRPGGIVLVAARGDGGTGALVLGADSAMPTCFGINSFTRHQAAAAAAGLPLKILEAPGLAFDVDRPSDLEIAKGLSGRTAALLRSLVREEIES